MAIIDELLQQQPQQPVAQKSNWIQDLISAKYSPKTERIKRQPVGFNFTRDPFDPSSYYKSLGQYRDISRAATNVTNVQAANTQEAEQKAAYEKTQKELQDALKKIDPNYTYGSGGGASPNTGKTSKNYHLKGVSSTTGSAANYFGSKYGIKTVYGLGKGSVPGSDHPKGKAIDLMINNIRNGKATGTAMANDIIKNAEAWNVKYVIWNRYIWYPGRGWHKYSGPSAHTDHVHVSFKK